ncbi:MAG: exonuclease SbcC [Nitrosarchaeum sp.]|nr:exonuclease SbcC [Nitrosarchaeum sp.]
MVFGWGKKKEVQSEEVPTEKQIPLSEVSKIVQKMLELRTNQILNDIKSIRDNTEPLISELISIGNTLEKDNLQVDDIDKHIRIIVVRGKQQVIDMIKKDANHLPKITSFDDVENMHNVLNQMLKKIGDVLGRQTRVIHIFAKKYAEKLKDILQKMNSNNIEIQQLLKNYTHTRTISEEITSSLQEIDNLKDTIVKKEHRITEIKNHINSLHTKITNYEDSIKKIHSSEKYLKFLELQKVLDSFSGEKNQLKNEINSQFTKISRPLSRYEHVSSMEKEQKILLSKLIEDPFGVLTPKNNDSIILILENVRKGISSGSISVKDVEKSFSYLTEIEEALAGYIAQVSDFTEKRQKIETQLSALRSNELAELTHNLQHATSDKDDSESKINVIESELNEERSTISKLISEIEVKLREFSNTVYVIAR